MGCWVGVDVGKTSHWMHVLDDEGKEVLSRKVLATEEGASGLTPLLGASLVAYAGGSPWLFVGYIMVVTVISLTALYFSPETYRRNIYPVAETREPEAVVES